MPRQEPESFLEFWPKKKETKAFGQYSRRSKFFFSGAWPAEAIWTDTRKSGKKEIASSSKQLWKEPDVKVIKWATEEALPQDGVLLKPSRRMNNSAVFKKCGDAVELLELKTSVPGYLTN